VECRPTFASRLNFKETGWEGVDCIDMGRSKDTWWTLGSIKCVVYLACLRK
jgi:hypothetical protein